MARNRRPELSFGILLLAYKLHSIGMNTIPPVTLLAVIGQCLLFLGVINPPWDRYEVCLSGEHILYHEDYRRLFLSAVEHSSDIHLYHNMLSLVIKGRTLEQVYGSVKFLSILFIFTLASSLTYVGLVWGMSEYFQNYNYMRECAIGFSGILFALKVLTTQLEGGSHRYIHGIMVPTKYAVWVELLVIHVLVPRASFTGHLAGILVGFAYIYGPLKIVVDTLNAAVGGSESTDNGRYRNSRQSYTYMHGTVGPEENEGNDSYIYTEELRRRRRERFE